MNNNPWHLKCAFGQVSLGPPHCQFTSGWHILIVHTTPTQLSVPREHSLSLGVPRFSDQPVTQWFLSCQFLPCSISEKLKGVYKNSKSNIPCVSLLPIKCKCSYQIIETYFLLISVSGLCQKLGSTMNQEHRGRKILECPRGTPCHLTR